MIPVGSNAAGAHQAAQISQGISRTVIKIAVFALAVLAAFASFAFAPVEIALPLSILFLGGAVTPFFGFSHFPVFLRPSYYASWFPHPYSSRHIPLPTQAPVFQQMVPAPLQGPRVVVGGGHAQRRVHFQDPGAARVPVGRR